MLTPSVAALVRRVDAEIVGRLGRSTHQSADGHALVVADHTRDPDARRGWAFGRVARSYKLHAVRDGRTGVITAAAVIALNEDESTVRRRLLRRTDLTGCTLLRADANYDCSALYEAAARCGGRLLAPRRRPGSDLGHRPHTTPAD